MPIKATNDIFNVSPKKDVYFYDRLNKKIDQALRRIDRLEDDKKGLKKRVQRLEYENKKLKDENSRLKSIISNNSNNSSLPPSSDQKPSNSKAPNEYNSRGRHNSHNHIGGQNGHHGNTLTRSEIEQKINSGVLEHKIFNIGEINEKDKNSYISKYVIDLEIRTVAYEYRIAKTRPIPFSLYSEVTYGSNIRTMIIDLAVVHSVAIDRIRSFIGNLTGNKILVSTGSISNFISDAAESSKASIANIASNLLSHNILYSDATNVVVNGKQEYVRNYSTENNVLYYPMKKKNLATLKASILNEYSGTLVHDHETVMYNFGSRHAECNAHFIRYLTKNHEDTGNTWSNDMISFLIELNNHRNRCKKNHIRQFTNEELRRYEERYDQILTKGREQNKHTKPRWTYQEERKLLTRATKYKEAQLRFLYDFDVGFTNNMSERDLRKCKTKQKVSGGFRTQSGKENYCTIMSIVETCKRRNINYFYAISRMLNGNTLFGGAE